MSSFSQSSVSPKILEKPKGNGFWKKMLHRLPVWLTCTMLEPLNADTRFKADRATGKDAQTATNIIEEIDVEDVATINTHEERNEFHGCEADVSLDDMDLSATQPQPPKNQGDSTFLKKKKKISNASDNISSTSFTYAVTLLAENIRIVGLEINKSIASKVLIQQKLEITIQESAIKLYPTLCEVEGLTEDDRYHALSKIQDHPTKCSFSLVYLLLCDWNRSEDFLLTIKNHGENAEKCIEGMLFPVFSPNGHLQQPFKNLTVGRNGQGCKLDLKLISVFVERWRSETHIFHLPCRECIITLEDVQLQLGLPWMGLYSTSLLNLLIREPYVTIIRILEGYLMSDKSRNLVHLRWLLKLIYFRAAGKLSWGSAMLSTLYQEMCRATQPNKIKIRGVTIRQVKGEYLPLLKIYDFYQTNGRKRIEPIIILELACDPDYMPWFRIHNKPYLLLKKRGVDKSMSKGNDRAL
ncbi:hypothetical protein CXB51_007986 [Gossypium anomalum]|uniref:Aminotransferase-like plant mobile domain-containing protein n=1 Tax=Gossypium anomalum TaxID=47600 RepID=A0A8J6DA69_9ROSI|nr:hypothetical protein CXB51_007986 [Gossypium anomalum]